MAVALVVMVSLILVACQGTSWQSDLHMHYFATLAILALYCDRDVVLAGAAATAIHHLGLNFLAPFLVFPGGAHFFRVVLHAGIVIMETGALVWMTSRIVDLLAMSACNLAASVTQSLEEPWADTTTPAGRMASSGKALPQAARRRVA